MTIRSDPPRRRPGPRRPVGLPSGPDEVRRAVLDAAGLLFAKRGIERVTLREIAEAADVHAALIRRYIGHREDLLRAVFDDLSDQVASVLADNPLSGLPFGPDALVTRWARVASAMVVSGRSLAGTDQFNPVQILADTLVDAYGADPLTARLRAAQVVAAAVGWRIFEDYLIGAGQLGEVPIEELRTEVTRSARRLAATPWPSPPDPVPRRPWPHTSN